MRNAPPLEYSEYEGGVRRDQSTLVFTGGFWHIGTGFPALLAWLRACSCTDIRYKFSETVYREGEEAQGST
jgi:hypothetical protein